MKLIVDGYNIIGAWPEFQDFQELAQSRDKLLDIMADYAGFSGDDVIVVFDGYHSGRKKTTFESYAGIDCVYTKNNETADQYIERLVDEELKGKHLSNKLYVRVATDDTLEGWVVLSRGAARVSAGELRRQVMQMRENGRSANASAGDAKGKMDFSSRLDEKTRRAFERMRRGK
jgi:predicted RNA-binding protein with PIN domain